MVFKGMFLWRIGIQHDIQDERQCVVENFPEQKLPERPAVELAYCVSQKRAVVIELGNARVYELGVLGAQGLLFVTERAGPQKILAFEVVSMLLFYDSWVRLMNDV